MASVASGASATVAQQRGAPSTPGPAAVTLSTEDSVPRLLQSLVPPAVVKWLRAESEGGPPLRGSGAGAPPCAASQRSSFWKAPGNVPYCGEGEDDVSNGVNPLFPLEGTVEAQLSRLGGEAWASLRVLGEDDTPRGPDGFSLETVLGGGGLSRVTSEADGSQLSLGESRALLQALLPLAAQRLCSAASTDEQQEQQSESNSQRKSGVFSLIPQPSEAATEGSQPWLGGPQKAAISLACGPLLGALCVSTNGLPSGAQPDAEVQRRRLRKRKQALLRQLLKSRAVLLQLSLQPEAEGAASAVAVEGANPPGAAEAVARVATQQQQELLRQRISVELRRAAIAAYNLSSCCQEERAQSEVVPEQTVQSEGSEVKAENPSSPPQADSLAEGPREAAAPALRQPQGAPAGAATAAYREEKGSFCSPELLLPLAALPSGVVDGSLVADSDAVDPEGPSPPPPSSPVWCPMGSPAEKKASERAPEYSLQKAGGCVSGGPWVLERIAFDGRRGAFVVSLVQGISASVPSSVGTPEGAPSCSASGGRRRHTKVFYCLCRSRDRAATVAAKYAELRQRPGLSPDEAAAAQTLSDEGETDEERDAPATTEAGKGPAKGTKGTSQLLQEVGEGLELLQLRRQRVALQQQRLRLFAAASRGSWFGAETMVSGAPYPLSDPPWRYRLAPVPPGVQLSEGSADAAEESPKSIVTAGFASSARTGAQKGKGALKLGGPSLQCGGGALGGPLTPYMGAEEEDSNVSVSGGRKASSSATAAGPAPAESGAPLTLGGPEVEEVPFAGDPLDAKPWPRPPVLRTPYTCFAVEASIGSGAPGGNPGQAERLSDNSTPDTESAETSWGEASGEGTAEEAASTAAATAAAAAETNSGDAAAARDSSKMGDTGGASKGGGGPGNISWAVRVTQRQKGDSWQLRMAASLMTRGFEEMREVPAAAAAADREGGPGPCVDFLLLYDSPEHRDAAVKTLHGLQPPTPTSFAVAVDSERRKELRQIYDIFLEPTFAVQADDKVVRIRDAVVNIFTYPHLYIMLHCLLTWDLRLLCLSNFLVWVCGYTNDSTSWFAEPADSETVSYLLNLANTFFDRLGAAATDTGARELPADDSALLQKNRLLLQLYMAQDQREGAAGAGGSAFTGSPQDSGVGAAAAAPSSPAAAAATSRPASAAAPGTGGGLTASTLGSSPPGAPSAAAGGYKEEMLQVAGVGPVDYTLPDGVKFDKSKLAFRCLWREGSAPIRLQQQLQQQQGMASPKTPAASAPSRWTGSFSSSGGLLKSQSSQQQNRSRTFSCRKYGLYQSKLLAMQARLASELLVPQPPATTRNRIAALPAVVFGLLPLPEPVESPQQAVEGVSVAERDRQSRRANWQQLLQQGGWKGGCPDAAFAEAAADAVEALVGDSSGHSKPSSKRKRHTGVPQRAASLLQQQQLQQQESAQAAAAVRCGRASDDPSFVSPADAAAGWSLAAGLLPGGAGGPGVPQGPLDSPAAWIVQTGDPAEGRMLQQQALSSKPLLACVWEHAACRWRVTLAAAGAEKGSAGGGGGGAILGRTCFFFSPSEPGKKKAALLLARRWAACQLLRGERLCVLARPVVGTETALDFLQACPGLWTSEDEADVNTLPLLAPQQLRSVAAACESAGAAGFAAAAPETGLNTCPTTPGSTFDCSSGFAGGGNLSRLTADGVALMQLPAEAVAMGGQWGDWQTQQQVLGGPFSPMGGGGGPWGASLGEGSVTEGGGPAKKAKPRSRPAKPAAPLDEAAAERLRSQKAAAARVRWMRYRMQQEAEAQQLTAALAVTLTDRPHMQDNNLNPLAAIFPM